MYTQIFNELNRVYIGKLEEKHRNLIESNILFLKIYLGFIVDENKAFSGRNKPKTSCD